MQTSKPCLWKNPLHQGKAIFYLLADTVGEEAVEISKGVSLWGDKARGWPKDLELLILVSKSSRVF